MVVNALKCKFPLERRNRSFVHTVCKSPLDNERAAASADCKQIGTCQAKDSETKTYLYIYGKEFIQERFSLSWAKPDIDQSAAMSDWSDQFRNAHEPDEQWGLRKRFLEMNRGRFPEDRLSCLAQTFANIEFMGCRYSKAVMDMVAEMAMGVVEEFREEQKSKLQRTFVTASAAASGKVNRRGPGSWRKPGGISFVPASSDLGPADEPQETRERERESEPLVPADSLASPRKWAPKARIAPPVDSSSSNSAPQQGNKSGRKRQAETKTSVVAHAKRGREAQSTFAAGPGSGRNPRRGQRAEGTNPPPSTIVLVTLDYAPEEHPCGVLSRSAGLCKSPCTWDYLDLPNGMTRCTVKMGGRTITSACAATRNESRDEAAAKAVAQLAKTCYTIQVKNRFLSDGDSSICMTDVLSSDAGASSSAISTENVGHRLLRMMGWAGGGLGADGSGRAEPVTADAVFNREGLGSATSSADFKRRIKEVIEDYAAGDSPYDLVFTSGFDNEQRKEMHTIARRLGLRSKSFGKNEDRFITISRKFDTSRLINELISRGGSSDKYRLVAPSGGRRR